MEIYAIMHTYTVYLHTWATTGGKEAANELHYLILEAYLHIVGAPLIEEFSSLIRARITVFSRELSF